MLKQVRSFSSEPIIILTVKREEADIVKGLEWGADDYIVKPCGQLQRPHRMIHPQLHTFSSGLEISSVDSLT
ncbi:MAG: hypothetical protein WBC11_02175 [Dehalococcoidia bacterium]